MKFILSIDKRRQGLHLRNAPVVADMVCRIPTGLVQHLVKGTEWVGSVEGYLME